MQISIQEWTEKLNKAKLYALPTVVKQLKKIEAGKGAQSITQLISIDPLVLAKLFKAVGSSQRHPPTIEQIPGLLGHDQYIHTIISSPTIDTILKGESLIAYIRCLQRAYHVGCIAKEIAIVKGYRQPMEFLYAGILYNLAELLIRSSEPELAMKVDQIDEHTYNWNGNEKNILGVSIRKIGLSLAQKWNLPDLLTQSLQDESHTNQKNKIISLSSQYLALASHNPLSDKIDNILKDLDGADTGLLNPLKKSVFLASLHAAKMLTKSLPAAATGKTRILLYPAYYKWKSTPGMRKADNSQQADAEKVSSMKETVLKPKTKASETVNKKPEIKQGPFGLIKESLDKLGYQDGFEKIIFSVISKDRKSIEGRYFYGVEQGANIRKLKVDRKHKNLFSLLLMKPQMQWIRNSNRDKVQPFIDASLEELLNGHDFYICSIFIRSKPVGLIYADGSCSEEGYKHFMEIVQNLTTSLNELYS